MQQETSGELRGRPRILVIDDTPSNLQILSRAFHGEFSLQLATSGAQGLAMAAVAAPDLVLLDIMMPEMDGYETCRRFKADPALTHVPIIFVSALNDADSEVKGLSLGAADYLYKPVNIAIARQRMRNLLERKQAAANEMFYRKMLELLVSDKPLPEILQAIAQGVEGLQPDQALLEQAAQLASIAIERNQAAERVRESEAHFRLLSEDVSDVVWRTDARLFLTYISPSDQRLRGYAAEEVIGKHVFEMFSEEGARTVRSLFEGRMAAESQGMASGTARFEVQHRCKDGRLIWGEVHSKPQRDAHGKIEGYHGITRDTTERRQLEDHVRQLAFYDPLTTLPNRRLLHDRLSLSVAESQRKDSHCALMILDLDNFKPLNDRHGHLVGDLLLVEAAVRLQACVREVDTVARFGGDEFVVLLRDLSHERAEATLQAAGVAEKIRLALSEPYVLKPGPTASSLAQAVLEHRSSASIGVALFLGRQAGPDEVLKWADAAMYQAKGAGRNAVRMYAGA